MQIIKQSKYKNLMEGIAGEELKYGDLCYLKEGKYWKTTNETKIVKSDDVADFFILYGEAQ